MKLIIEFILELNDAGKKDKEILKELKCWKKKLEKYKTGKILEDIYEIDQNNVLYSQIVDFAKRFPEEIKLNIVRCYAEYEQKEYEKAVAFVPQFSEWVVEDYNDSLELYECRYCCARINEPDKIYINPYRFMTNKENGYVENKAKGCSVFRVEYEPYNRFMVSPELYEKLMADGVSDKYFRPAYSLRKKILAYELIGNNILPENSYEDGNYYFQYICPKCGAVNYDYELDEYYCRQKTINQEGIDSLKEVNATAEYYGNYHKIIINKKLHDLIIKYVPTANFLPVFKRENK